MTNSINPVSQEQFVRKLQTRYFVAQCVNRDTAIQKIGVWLFLANDEAGLVLFDAMAKLRRSPLYRHKVKQLANKAQKAYDAYESHRNSLFTDKETQDISYSLYDKFQDFISPHIKTLRFSVLAVLTKLNVDERDMLSYAITAYSVLFIAVAMSEAEFKTKKVEYGVDISNDCRGLTLANVSHTWRELLHLLVPPEIEAEVSKDKNFALAYNVLTLKFVSFDDINNISKDIIKENREALLSKAKDEDTRKMILNT